MVWYGMTHSPTQTLASSAYFESQTCKLARMGATNSAKKACKYEKAIPDEFCTLYLWVWICKLLNTTLAGFSFRFLKHWLWFKYSLMVCQCDPERNIYPSTPQLFPIYHLLVDLGRISFSIHILTAALLLFRPSTLWPISLSPTKCGHNWPTDHILKIPVSWPTNIFPFHFHFQSSNQ